MSISLLEGYSTNMVKRILIKSHLAGTREYVSHHITMGCQPEAEQVKRAQERKISDLPKQTEAKASSFHDFPPRAPGSNEGLQKISFQFIYLNFENPTYAPKD